MGNGASKIDNTTGITPPAPGPGKEAGVAGAFLDRTVAVNGNQQLPPAVDARTAAAAAALPDTPVQAREATQTVSQQLVRQLASEKAGQVEKLGNYLANHVEAGKIPRELLPDFETAVGYTRRVDEDIARAAGLLDKLDRGASLSEGEQAEVQALLSSAKYNLSLMQKWLGSKTLQLAESGQLSLETETLLQSLQERFADRHMDVADLISLYDLDEMPQGTVSRGDRINANLLWASTALKAAHQLPEDKFPPAAKLEILRALEAHHSNLLQAKAVSDDPHQMTALAAGGPLSGALTGKELWQPFELVTAKKGKKEDIQQLKAHWDNKAQNQGSSEPWLPLAHGKVGQSRMLQEFIQHRLQAAGVEKSNLPDLKFMFKKANNQVMNEQSWGPIHREVRYNLPEIYRGGAPPETKLVNSDIVPAKAFEKNFPQDYPANGINCGDRLQYQHAPNLAHTRLTGENGQVLFSGLRHGVLDAYELTGKSLSKLPDANVRSLISDLLLREGALSVPEGNTREQTIDDILSLIRSSPKSAAQYADLMRVEASRNMAQEVAVTALAADPDKLQRALNGEVVNLDLSSISLLTPDSLRPLIKDERSNEKVMLKNQTAALQGLSREKPAVLQIRDAKGNPVAVRANINVRTFNFGVNAGAVGRMMKMPSHAPGWKKLMGWGFSMQQNNPELRKLLGPSNSPALGGEIGQKVMQLEGEIKELSTRLMAAGGDDASGEEVSDEERLAMENRFDQLIGDREKLRVTAQQLKVIWREGSFTKGGQEPYKMVSRLALLTHMAGHTPLFNCKSGKDRTGQLDAEVKCLAAFTERAGAPHPPDQDAAELRQMRSQFTLGTGNLEMQRLNTGLPGYKLEWSGVPGLANMVAEDAMEPLYRGGSGHISS